MRNSPLADQLAQHIAAVDKSLDVLQRSRSTALIDTGTPETLFHYTNDIGLHGILTSGKLWLTDLTSVNDPSELEHGLDVGIKELHESNTSPILITNKFVNLFGSLLRNRAQQLSHNFACSFSTNGNELSQWRSYAENGRGYALAFSGIDLEPAFANQKDGVVRQAFPVLYSEEMLRSRHRESISLVLPKVQEISKALGDVSLSGTQIDTALKEFSVMLACDFLLTSTYFKHPAYLIETEYRFHEVFRISENVPNLRTRARRYSLVNFRDFEWKRLAPNSLKKLS